MELNKNEVHIWSFPLHLPDGDSSLIRASLSQEELERADRFHFEVHRDRFLAAHYQLRVILAGYLHITPAQIRYAYSTHQKPSLAVGIDSLIQFNLSHSHDRGVCAITLGTEVGIDIEKIESEMKDHLAKRYFSAEEYQVITRAHGHDTLSMTCSQPKLVKQTEQTDVASADSSGLNDHIALFYTIWARKEAVLKATGKGLRIPLNCFTVPLGPQGGPLTLEDTNWSIIPLSIEPGYASALAIEGSVKKISYWVWHENKPVLTKEDVF